MREIKFRGKRYGDGAWVYGSLYQGIKEGEKYSIILTDSGYHLAPPDDRNLAIAFEENEVNVVIPDTIGQFTGLHDKHGKEIYEGDIVKQTWGSPHFVNGILYDCFGRIGDIRYECDLIGVHTKNGLYRIVGSDISNTVIGNIHDNPELLKTE